MFQNTDEKITTLIWMGIYRTLLSSIFSAVIINIELRNSNKISVIQQKLNTLSSKSNQS